MHLESGSCDDEQVVLVARNPGRSFVRMVGWCVVGTLGALCGSQLWRLQDSSGADVSKSVVLDLTESKLRIPIDVVGINYNGLSTLHPPHPPPLVTDLHGTKKNGNPYSAVTDTEQTLFRKAAIAAVADKGKIDVEQVAIPGTIVSTPAAGTSPARSEFSVIVSVPAEIGIQALQDRLQKDGNLTYNIRKALDDHKLFPGTQMVTVLSQPMQQSIGEASVYESQIRPLIVLDLEVEGVDYSSLARDSVLKPLFVDALQGGIQNGQSLVAKSTALDIMNGGISAGAPVVHVTARFPVPTGMKADATMSKWPGGPTAIGAAVLKNLQKIPNIDSVTHDGAGGHHTISVSTGTLHFGAVRQVFASQIRTDFEIQKLRREGPGDFIEPKVVKAKIIELVKKQVGEGQEVEAVYLPVDQETNAVTDRNLVVQIQVSALESASDIKISDWQAKMIAVGSALQADIRGKHPTAIDGTKDDLKVLTGAPALSQQLDLIDFDVVVHGIDYEHILPGRKGQFLSDFVSAVREGITTTANCPAQVVSVKDKIKATLSSSPMSSNAVNVRIHIPAPPLPDDVNHVINNLETYMTSEIHVNLEKEIKAIPGVSYITSWTTNAIEVKPPLEPVG